MTQFWVVGGEYEDTGFHETVNGNEEWIGPFSDYDGAKQAWASHAWHPVDPYRTRYRIEKIDPDTPPPCTD